MSFYTTTSWKKTVLGSDISLFASAPLAELREKNPILLMGGIHGDEPEGVALAEATLQWLKNAAEELAPWVLIPCLNRDGFQRKTRVNGRGVDLNRNYPSKNWSPQFEKERYYPGPAAGSEPEIQGVIELLQNLRPRLAIHCHSWQPCVVATGSRSLTDARRLAEASGYEVQDSIGYPTPGSLSQYGWHDLQIPVICIEEQELLSDLSVVWPRFATGMQSIFRDLSLRA